MDVAQLVEPRVVIPVVVGSSPIVHPRIPGVAGKSRCAGLTTKGSAAEVTVVGRIEPRLLPAVYGVMSAEIASCDFGQSN